MEIVMNQLEPLFWIFTSAGLASVAAFTLLLLSGLPGAILPNIEATQGARDERKAQ